MKRISLVEYVLTPEELERAVLEFCARNAPADIAGKLRHVYIRHNPDKRGKPHAVALVELSEEDQ